MLKLGGGTGLGSIIYALAVMSKCLCDDRLLADAQVVAALITDDLIAADRQLDVMGGSAGAILGLLRLYRDSHSGDVLARATRCGEHLLGQRRVGPEGTSQLVQTRFGPAGPQRHVPRRGGLCLRAGLVGAQATGRE